MVEKKELAIVFVVRHHDDIITEYVPTRVIEGNYDKENNWFYDTLDGVTYLHIDIPSKTNTGYGCRTTIEIMKNSLSEESIDKIKIEMLEYAQKYKFIKDISRTDCIVAIEKETGHERIFEDADNMPEFIPSKGNHGDEDILLMTPNEIEERIKRTIKGQDEAIRKIVTALWTTMNFRELRKKNMLVIGPSGVGKTAIFEKIKDILNIPVVIFSVPGLSQAGYVGRSVDEILKQVYYEANFNIDDAERSIVILDEIDKIASNHGGDISTSSVQNELLKIIEGCERYVETQNPTEPSFTINTSDMIFIGTGAFQELFEKEKAPIGYDSQPKQSSQKKSIDTDRLIKYGLKRELIGRLPILVELSKLGKPEFREIVTESDESELSATINALRIMDVEIENLEEVIDLIVDDAITRQIGARGLVLTINNMFQEIFYEVANNPTVYEKVIIGQNIINNPYDFELIERRTNKKVRIKNK